ncbi:periplasmic heavy metal sensor [Sedimenticola selenatireducens]|nr:periplasmic heavy metal sensor [Sedimenticola selenatireducens]
MIKRYIMPVILVLSLFINVGVIASVVGRTAGDLFGAKAIQHGHTALANHLELDQRQFSQWRSNEQVFLSELKNSWAIIRNNRELMIREIFSDDPDIAEIESLRDEIAEQQSIQQHVVIDQLMRERQILNQRQRNMLEDLLITQYPLASIEQMMIREE